MPRSHLSGCIQASYSSPVLQMKMRVRAVKELLHSVRRVHVSARVFFQCLLVLRYDDELPEHQQKTKGGETKQTPKSVCHLCSHTVHTCREYSGTVTGPGKCWSGAWPILQRPTHPTPPLSLPPPSPPPSPFLCSLWTQSEATRLHNSSQNLHFTNTIIKKKTQPAIGNGFKEKK